MVEMILLKRGIYGNNSLVAVKSSQTLHLKFLQDTKPENVERSEFSSYCGFLASHVVLLADTEVSNERATSIFRFELCRARNWLFIL
jgi:hypothetical protein